MGRCSGLTRCCCRWARLVVSALACRRIAHTESCQSASFSTTGQIMLVRSYVVRCWLLKFVVSFARILIDGEFFTEMQRFGISTSSPWHVNQQHLLRVCPSLEPWDEARLTKSMSWLSVEIMYLSEPFLRGVFQLMFIAARVAINVQLSLSLLLV